MATDRHDLAKRCFISLGWFMAGMALLLFVPAGTLAYWHAWVFLAVFGALSAGGTLYFLKHDPALVERRSSVGPAAESDPAQKRIMTFFSFGVIFLVMLPALDRRFGCSDMPAIIAVIGDTGIVLGFLGIFRVFRENSYAAATIGTAEGQTVIATGPYAVVRHPMYSAALLLFVGIPLALGSWWGLLMAPVLAGMLAWRLTEEERFLVRALPGYDAYRSAVHYRLIPGVW